MKSPSVPAELLNSLIQEYGLSISKISEDTKLSPSMVRQLATGKTKITPATAARLDKYFGFKSGEWLQLQYNADQKEVKKDKELQELLKAIPKAKKQKEPAAKKSAKKDESAAAPKKRGRKKAEEPVSEPKRRGRKPSVKTEVRDEPTLFAEAAPKKRGRPRSAVKAETVSAEPKKRGRKPKPVSPDAPVKTPGKRGRKPKLAVAAMEDDQSESELRTHSILIKQDGRVIDSNDLPSDAGFDTGNIENMDGGIQEDQEPNVDLF